MLGIVLSAVWPWAWHRFLGVSTFLGQYKNTKIASAIVGILSKRAVRENGTNPKSGHLRLSRDYVKKETKSSQ